MDFLKNLCKEKGLIIAESKSDDTLLVTIMSEDKDCDNTLNISIDGNKLEAYIMDSNGKVLENFNKLTEGSGVENETLSEIVNTFDAFNDMDGEIEGIDVEDINVVEEAAEEGYKSIDSGLYDLKLKSKWIGDRIKELSELTDDVEYISVLLDLASSAYSLYLDIDSAIETYDEMMNPDESVTESFEKKVEVEKEFNESKSRLVIAKSLMEVRKLNSNDIISNDKLEEFESVFKKLFK